MTHSDDLSAWLKGHSSIKVPSNKVIFDNKVFKLLKYFISSNSAASQFDSKYFRDILDYKIPYAKTFSNNILPEVIKFT